MRKRLPGTINIARALSLASQQQIAWSHQVWQCAMHWPFTTARTSIVSSFGMGAIRDRSFAAKTKGPLFFRAAEFGTKRKTCGCSMGSHRKSNGLSRSRAIAGIPEEAQLH